MTQRTAAGGQAEPPTASGSFNDELHYSLLTFLKKLGYRQTEQIFREEARNAGIETVAFELRAEQDSSLQPSILLGRLTGSAGGGEAADSVASVESSYEQVFARLKKWCFDSLDIYRDELCQVLYPVFVHSFLDLVAKNLPSQAHRFFEKFREDFKLMHGDEMTKLKSLNDGAQLKENSLAAIYRSNKYNLTMSAYSFQILVNFLQENSMFIMLKILNQYLSVRVLVSRPSTGPAGKTTPQDKQRGIVGLSSALLNQINTEPLNWGVSPIDPANETEILRRLRNDLVASGTFKSPEQLGNAISQMKKSLVESLEHAPKSSALSRPPAGASELELAVERIKGMSNRAMLSSTALPSICCYTIHNSYDGVCSADFSPSFSMMAVGNRESYIEVWSLTRERMRAIRPSTELAAMSATDLESTEKVFEPEGTWSKRLVGHSGPVYACRFTPDGQFLFSGSMDGTIRLWSLGTFSSLVAYRGHNGPVWDVDVGPSGHYFVSGSADRTARLWSTQGMQPLRLFVGHLSDVDVVKFHPNSNYVLTGSSDKSIRMWDIQKGNCVRLFTGHARGISSLAVSPNGRLLASGDVSGVVKIWDIAEGRLVKTVTGDAVAAGAGRTGSIYVCAFCQDGKVLATCAADNTVKIWDVEKVPSAGATGSEDLLASFSTKQTPIIAARFSPRNVLTVVGSFANE